MNTNMKSVALMTLATLIATPNFVLAQSQTPQSSAKRQLNLSGFLEEVLKTNMDLATKWLDITSAETQIAIERLFPDPEFAAGISSKEMNGPNKPENPTQYMAEFSWTLELGGKRAARTEAAKSAAVKARTEFEAFLEETRAVAAAAFIDALRTRRIADEKRKIHQGFKDILRMNEIRHSAGDIGGAELAQSRMEARKFEGELIQAEADVQLADLAMLQLLGPDVQPFSPVGSLEFSPVAVSHEDVMSAATSRHPEIQVAKQGLELANSEARLAKANRWTDIGLSVGLNHTPAVRPYGVDLDGNPFPVPALMSNSISATLSIPIPFSRRQKGELVQAEAARSQARLELSSMELKTRAEAQAVLTQHEASLRLLNTFKESILEDADKVLEASRFSYQKGHIPLMEYVMASQSCAEAYISYIDAQANYAKALLALDRVTGGSKYLMGVQVGR
jgi:cobalt-zinc-cadmium efflux system outer membrane protein